MRIEKGTTVRGSFQVEGDLVVEGTLEGKVFVSGRLEIDRAGVLTGEATCSGGAILGKLSGIVHSAEPMNVAADAVVSGRIMAPALDFGEGRAEARPAAAAEPRPDPPPARRTQEVRRRRAARPPTVTGDQGQVVVTPRAVLRERS